MFMCYIPVLLVFGSDQQKGYSHLGHLVSVVGVLLVAQMDPEIVLYINMIMITFCPWHEHMDLY